MRTSPDLDAPPAAWRTLAVARPPPLSTSRTELSPVTAAERLLPPGTFEAVSVMDITFDSQRHMHGR